MASTYMESGGAWEVLERLGQVMLSARLGKELRKCPQMEILLWQYYLATALKIDPGANSGMLGEETVDQQVSNFFMTATHPLLMSVALTSQERSGSVDLSTAIGYGWIGEVGCTARTRLKSKLPSVSSVVSALENAPRRGGRPTNSNLLTEGSILEDSMDQASEDSQGMTAKVKGKQLVRLDRPLTVGPAYMRQPDQDSADDLYS